MVKPIVSLPMVICCGRLVVVSSIPPGDFFFVFLANLLFLGAIAVQVGRLGPPEKATVWGMPICHGNAPQCQKSRSWRWKLPVWQLPFGQSGAFFFWRTGTGRFEPPDVTSTSGNVALWTSRALKYFKYHRTGRSNERFGGCAAKKSPFLQKRTEHAKKAKKGQKSGLSQWPTTVRAISHTHHTPEQHETQRRPTMGQPRLLLRPPRHQRPRLLGRRQRRLRPASCDGRPSSARPSRRASDAASATTTTPMALRANPRP